MKIEEHIPLSRFTTFAIGGPARFFVQVKTTDELEEALKFWKEKNMPLFILGGGSNLLISDAGFPGLVIKIEIEGIEEKKIDAHTSLLIGGAGVNWDEFVAYAVDQGLHGIENLSLIPGTLGAAPVQNIGAYGVEAKDTLAWVEAIDSTTGELVTLRNSECAFAYRDSIFKKQKQYVITRVALRLSRNGALHTEYKDIKRYFDEHSEIRPTIENVRNAVIEIRTNKLPDVNKIGTAGSFFKNPIITKEHYKKLLLSWSLMPSYEVDGEHVKIPLAWVLDNVCGFRGVVRGNVGVYKNQALVLVNNGAGTSSEVRALAEEMRKSVLEKTGIEIEREVEYV